MARPGRQTHAKRQREFAKQDARRAKDERRAARKAAKLSGVSEPDDQLSGGETADSEATQDTVDAVTTN